MGYRPTITLYVENELVDIRTYKDYNNRALFLFAIEDAISFNIRDHVCELSPGQLGFRTGGKLHE